MKNESLSFLNSLHEISHPHFQIELHRDTFLKAFIQIAKHDLEKLDSAQRHQLAKELYEALFIQTDAPLRAILAQIRIHLKATRTLEDFLSNYFYIVLNYYTKSFYGHNFGWKRILKLAHAIDALIEWSKTLSFESESGALVLTPEEEAIEALEQLRLKKVKITVMNTYQGVPIQYKASIIHTTEKSVYLKVHPLQEAAARQQQSIYIIGNAPLNFDLFARIKAVRYKGYILLELTQFAQLKETLYQRQSVRVQPFRALYIHVSYENVHYKVRLFDISIGGIAVVTHNRVDIPKYASILIDVPELLFSKPMELKATLVHRSHFENSEKLHLQLALTTSQERLLSHYVAKREQEIIQTLKTWS